MGKTWTDLNKNWILFFVFQAGQNDDNGKKGQMPGVLATIGFKTDGALLKLDT